MHRCNHCNINTKQAACPLCGQGFESSDSEHRERFYPSYDRRMMRKRRAPKIAILAGMMIIMACLVINMAVMPHFLWIFYVAGSVLYGIISFNHTILSKTHFEGKIVAQVASLTLLLLIIDSQSGILEWSVNYAVPFLMIAGMILFSYMIIAARIEWNAFVSFALMFLLSFIPGVLYFSGVATVIWPSIAAAAYAVMALAVLVLLAHQAIWSQIGRRLHF